MDYYKESLKLHKKHQGKLAVISKVPVRNKTDLSLAYTPGVAEVSRLLAKQPEKAKQYSIKGNTIAVVSDGSAVLGLGNIGPLGALPVMEGKAVLFKEFGGVNAVPIVLNTQDTEEIINIAKAIAPTFAGINLEDISAPRCFEIEERLKQELDIPVFHDDQHGTAIVVLAGLINSLKLLGKNINNIKIVISGTGAAGVAIAKLLKQAGATKIVMVDSKGVINSKRQDLPQYKQDLLKYLNYNDPSTTLAQALKGADVFIGVSVAGIVTKEMVKSMAKDPIIMAMANPTPEIMPEEALEAGAKIVATGRSDYPNQINNVLAFPGVFKGALKNNVKQITDKMKINAAYALANLVKNPTFNKIIPDPFDKRVADAVANAIKE